MAWLWTDTLADLLETFDRVGPDELRPLRVRPVAYRVEDEQGAVDLAREVFEEVRSLRAPSPSGRPPAPV